MVKWRLVRLPDRLKNRSSRRLKRSTAVDYLPVTRRRTAFARAEE